jgi:hypothetical protein
MFSTAEEFKNNKFLNQIDRKMKELWNKKKIVIIL